MHSLYIDSSLGLVIGLLDSDYSWVEYLSLDEKKPSEIIHFEIYKILQKHNLKLSDIRCFVSSGPGSYTGMRLSEGVAQMFELASMPVYSFCHFEVPILCGFENGFWATNAFKGQVFIYNWKGENIEKQLVKKEDFFIEDEAFGFTLDSNDPLFCKLISTKNLIQEKSSEIFSKIAAIKLRESPFYFRTLDEEFN